MEKAKVPSKVAVPSKTIKTGPPDKGGVKVQGLAQKQKVAIKKKEQFLILIRHGERLDNYCNVSDEERKATKVENHLDIPLSQQGKRQAFETGEHLRKLLKDKGIETGANVKLLSSPYLRCLQTSEGVLRGLVSIPCEITVREELSEMQIGSYGHEAKIEDLIVNKA